MLKHKGALALLTAWFVFILICAYWAPHFSNDYRYMLVEDTARRASSLSDIALSQYRHCFEWGGRTVNHCLAMLVLMAPKWVEALVQAAVYTLLILGILRLSCGKDNFAQSLKLKNIFIITALLWVNLRYFGEVVFNVVSGANYLYSSLIMVLFLIPWADALMATEPGVITWRSLAHSLRHPIAALCSSFAGNPGSLQEQGAGRALQESPGPAEVEAALQRSQIPDHVQAGFKEEQGPKPDLKAGSASLKADDLPLDAKSNPARAGEGAAISGNEDLPLKPASVLKSAAALIFGIICGWTNENSGFALCTVLFCCLALQGTLGFKFTWRHYCSYLGLVAGFLLLILAPGNEERLESMQERGFDYASHLDEAALILGQSLLLFYAILGLLGATLYSLLKHRALSLESTEVRRALLCAAIGLLSLFIMLLSPTFPARASSFACVLLIAALLSLMHYAKAVKISIFRPRTSVLLTLAFVLYLIPTASNCLEGYHQAYWDQKERSSAIAKARLQGVDHLVVKSFQVEKSKYLFIADVREDEDYFSNQILERFYHLKSLRRECDPDDEGVNLDFKILGTVGSRSCQAYGKS